MSTSGIRVQAWLKPLALPMFTLFILLRRAAGASGHGRTARARPTKAFHGGNDLTSEVAPFGAARFPRDFTPMWGRPIRRDGSVSWDTSTG